MLARRSNGNIRTERPKVTPETLALMRTALRLAMAPYTAGEGWHIKLLPTGTVEVTLPDGTVRSSDPPTRPSAG